ncbi:polymer-forming cytoskeletal protein [Kushneria sp. AK178]
MFQRTRGVDDTGSRDAAPASVTPPDTGAAEDRSTRLDRRALIGAQTRVTGDMTGEEDLHIEGHIVGCVTFTRHGVDIGVDGSVEGDVVAQSMTVGGTIRGRLIASGSVRVLAGAHVSGEIHAPGLVIEEGAEFQGTVDMNPDNPLLEQLFDAAPAAQGRQVPTGALPGDSLDDEALDDTETGTFDDDEAPASR